MSVLSYVFLFKQTQVLEVRTENLKQQKSRRDQFSSPTSMTAPASTPSLLLADEEAAQKRAENTAINIGGGKCLGERKSS